MAGEGERRGERGEAAADRAGDAPVEGAAVEAGRGGTGRLGLGTSIALRLVVPAAIGAVTGACVAGASWITEDRALAALAALPEAWPALLSPLALLVTLAVATWVTRAARPSTAELYIVTYHAPGGELPLRQIPGRILGAMTTVGFGGSQGLESASALIGAALGQIAGHVRGAAQALALEGERRTLMVAGASAGIAAVFSSPAVGALYGIEIPYRRDVDARRMVPCAVAAGTSFLVRDWLVGARQLAVVEASPRLDGVFVAGVLLVGVACALAARFFAFVAEELKGASRRLRPIARAAAAGVVLAGLAFAGHAITGEWITFGPGYVAADWLASGPQPLGVLALALVVRAAGTLVCVAGGGGGGVFTSLACMGVFIGHMVGDVLGRTESQVFPFLGAACFLAAGYRLPLACMMFVFEGSPSFAVAVAGLVAVSIGQVLMQDESVSDAKRDHRLD